MAQTVEEASTPGATTTNGDASTPPSKTPATPASPGDKASLLTLPLARVKRMIKEEDDISTTSAEADFVVARATELFIDGLASRTLKHVQGSKGVTYTSVARAVGDWAPCDFLQGVFYVAEGTMHARIMFHEQTTTHIHRYCTNEDDC